MIPSKQVFGLPSDDEGDGEDEANDTEGHVRNGIGLAMTYEICDAYSKNREEQKTLYDSPATIGHFRPCQYPPSTRL